MNTPFIYDRYVTGKNFIGRKTECLALCNLLSTGENVVIYEPPKCGKTSVIQQTLFDMKVAGKQFNAIGFNMFNVRNEEQFLSGLGTAVIRALATTPDEYSRIVSEYLGGAFSFDEQKFASEDKVICVSEEITEDDIERILRLPENLAEETGIPVIIVLDEFQNLLEDSRYEKVLKIFENVLKINAAKSERLCSFIFSGSRVNAMKFIFAEQKYFYRTVVHLPLGNVDERDVTEYIVKGFLASGKVIEKELVIEMFRMVKGNLWYLNHITAICDSMSRGFMNDAILAEAIKRMISIHEPKFKAIMANLTGHQISLLKAILDGVSKFSATDVIEKYSLNSSANVRRVKDALRKKEIILFNEKDEPMVADPLFERWVSKEYFGMEI